MFLTTEKTEQGGEGEANELLARGRVLVVGVGGLGSAAALALAQAGVGHIELVDGDRVERSNLQRQVVHSTATLGRLKVESAAARLGRLYPRVRIGLHREHLDRRNLAGLFAGVDFVIDGTDGAAAKFLINDGAVATGKPYSHAGVLGWCGQTMTVLPRQSACYRCLFPAIPDEEDLPTCQVAGVIGPVVGAIGAVQASEAIKFLLGDGDLLLNRILTWDALSARWRCVPLFRDLRCPVCADPDPRPSAGRELTSFEGDEP